MFNSYVYVLSNIYLLAVTAHFYTHINIKRDKTLPTRSGKVNIFHEGKELLSEAAHFVFNTHTHTHIRKTEYLR